MVEEKKGFTFRVKVPTSHAQAVEPDRVEKGRGFVFYRYGKAFFEINITSFDMDPHFEGDNKTARVKYTAEFSGPGSGGCGGFGGKVVGRFHEYAKPEGRGGAWVIDEEWPRAHDDFWRFADYAGYFIDKNKGDCAALIIQAVDEALEGY